MSTPAQDSVEDRTGSQIRLLRELAEIGMEIARCLRPAQAAGADAEALPDHERRFERVARAIRQVLALEACLIQGLHIRAAERAARQSRADLQHATEQRMRIRRLANPSIAAATEAGTPGLRLRFESHLSDPDFAAELATRPLPEIVARICRDLGIPTDRSNWPESLRQAASLQHPPPGPSAPDAHPPPD